MKNFCIKYLKYILFFCGFLFFNLFLSRLTLDEVWSYGFSYNIVKGAVPYNDFNMVITPFYPFLNSLFLFVFGNNLLVFHIVNAFFGTAVFALLFSLLKKKAWIVLPFLLFPMNVTFPNYNFFLLLLFFVLFYGEEKKWPDLVMGILIGLLFLTKQSVGGVFLLSILFFYKQKKRLFTRLLGFFIPNVILFVYLLIAGNLSSFLDLCFYGLFDFGSGNGKLLSPFFVLVIFLCGIFIFFIKQNPKKIFYVYGLLFSSICVPLFDCYHFQLFLVACLGVYFYEHDFSFLRYTLIGICLLIGFTGTYFFHINWSGEYPNSFSHFEYRYMMKKAQNNTKETLELMKKYDNKVMFLSPDAYYFKIILNQKVDYLDLINVGNTGYHGSEKIMKRIQKLDPDTVFFVLKEEEGSRGQTDKIIMDYVLKNGTKIDENSLYFVYRFEE